MRRNIRCIIEATKEVVRTRKVVKTKIPKNCMEIKKGTLLISEPFLGDQNFTRSVILLCEHNESGSFGLVVNKTTNYILSDVLDISIKQPFPLYLGGPVEVNTLHFIHKKPDAIVGGVNISNNITWGGDFERLKLLLENEVLSLDDIRFFLGYAGWERGQLEQELNDNFWIATSTNPDVLLEVEPEDLWQHLMKDLGGSFTEMANYPIDPRLN